MIRFATLAACLVTVATPAAAQSSRTSLDAKIASQAAANGVPEALVRRVIARESGYNTRLVGRGGATGLMQIKLATARSMGYTGSASGLLDPDTNMTYAVKYLAGAYKAAGGNHDRAVGLYARGYYTQEKRHRVAQGVNAYAQPYQSRRQRRAAARNPLAFLFGAKR
jgi:soluble lytic murein transglycosylase-like protein